MNFFVSAGEPSGDLHGANLVRAIRARDSNAHITGFGGPRMRDAGADLLFPLSEFAVMGLTRVVRHLPTFFRLAAQAKQVFREQRPDAVVLIDYPGFNFALAKRAHAVGVPAYFFVPPQIWAWRTDRVKKVRKWCRGVLSALTFEHDWYKSRGVESHYVGHPYFDVLSTQQLDPLFLTEQRVKGGVVVGLLPGSRNQEVSGNTPTMVRVAAKVYAVRPDARFLVAAFKDAHAAELRAAFASTGLPVEVHVGRTAEIIELSEACVTVSGSVSLELLYRAKPTAIVYQMNAYVRFWAPWFKKVPYYTLVNLLAREELYPEYITSRDKSDEITAHVLKWLGDSAEKRALVSRLVELRDRVAVPGACDRAADFLLATAVNRRAAA